VKTIDQIKQLIISNLTADLLNKKYHPNNNSLAGHCYVASEVAYHLLGGKAEGWTPQFIKHESQSHWFLKHNSGFILDITAKQFQSSIDYSQAIGKGFLTKQPSKRARKLLAKLK
jgi:hypothetical protein